MNTHVRLRLPDEVVSVDAPLRQESVAVRAGDEAVEPRPGRQLGGVGGGGKRAATTARRGGAVVGGAVGRGAAAASVVGGEVLTQLDKVVFGYQANL